MTRCSGDVSAAAGIASYSVVSRKYDSPTLARGRARNPHALNLALQGGGTHGAFTWGVLDRLLEDDRLEIEGISGTSAGAMNAVVLAQGFARAGKDGARN